MHHIPTIIEKNNSKEYSYDVLSRLLKDRIIFLNGEINDFVAASIVAQLLYLEAEDAKKDIYLYINSPGGIITSGLSIYDTMNFISCDIKTICIGQACSMGSFLLSAGTKGKRISLPNARIMIHQPSGGAQGQASDIEIQAKEILYLKDKLNQFISNNSYGKLTKKQVAKLTDRDNFCTPEEYLQYGLIDEIIESRENIR